jgi:hypothetical protein
MVQVNVVWIESKVFVHRVPEGRWRLPVELIDVQFVQLVHGLLSEHSTIIGPLICSWSRDKRVT